MTRMALLLAVLAAALVASGCGNRLETVTIGETEGIYIDVDDLKYQVQLSRYLNPSAVEDRAYFVGLPENTAPPTGEETWFGVFLRVQNSTGRTIVPANDFQIVDTQENVYRPLPIDTDINPFAYSPEPIGPESLIPQADSAAAEGTIQGSLLLFKVRTESLQNRPLEFRFRRGSGQVGIVDLDV